MVKGIWGGLVRVRQAGPVTILAYHVFLSAIISMGLIKVQELHCLTTCTTPTVQ